MESELMVLRKIEISPMGSDGWDCCGGCGPRAAWFGAVDCDPRTLDEVVGWNRTLDDGRVVFDFESRLGGGMVGTQLGSGLGDSLGSGFGLDGAFADSFGLPQVHSGSYCNQAGNSVASSASCPRFRWKGVTYFLAHVRPWPSPLPWVVVIPPAAIVVSSWMVSPRVSRPRIVRRSKVGGIPQEPWLLIVCWTAPPRWIWVVWVRGASAERLPRVRHLCLLTDAVVVCGIPGLALSKNSRQEGPCCWPSQTGFPLQRLSPNSWIHRIVND